jgi:hypothetical protein
MYYSILIFDDNTLFHKTYKECNLCRYFKKELLFFPLFSFNVDSIKVNILCSEERSNRLSIQLIKTDGIIKKLLLNKEYHHIYPDNVHIVKYEIIPNKFIILDNIKWKNDLKTTFKVWRKR